MFPKEAQEAVFTEPEKRTPMQWQMYYRSRSRLPADSTLERNLKGEDKQRYAELKKELAKYDQLKPAEPPVAEAMVDSGRIAPPTFLSREGRLGCPGRRGTAGFSQHPRSKAGADCSTGRR